MIHDLHFFREPIRELAFALSKTSDDRKEYRSQLLSLIIFLSTSMASS